MRKTRRAQFAFRLSAEEKRDIEAAAALCEISAGDWLRRAARAAYERQRQAVNAVEPAATGS